MDAKVSLWSAATCRTLEALSNTMSRGWQIFIMFIPLEVTLFSIEN